jgi:hypothetical protein
MELVINLAIHILDRKAAAQIRTLLGLMQRICLHLLRVSLYLDLSGAESRLDS